MRRCTKKTIKPAGKNAVFVQEDNFITTEEIKKSEKAKESLNFKEDKSSSPRIDNLITELTLDNESESVKSHYYEVGNLGADDKGKEELEDF